MDPGAAVALTRRTDSGADMSRHVVAHASKLARELAKYPGQIPGQTTITASSFDAGAVTGADSRANHYHSELIRRRRGCAMSTKRAFAAG